MGGHSNCLSKLLSTAAVLWSSRGQWPAVLGSCEGQRNVEEPDGGECPCQKIRVGRFKSRCRLMIFLLESPLNINCKSSCNGIITVWDVNVNNYLCSCGRWTWTQSILKSKNKTMHSDQTVLQWELKLVLQVPENRSLRTKSDGCLFGRHARLQFHPAA